MFAGIENVHRDPRRGWTAFASLTLQAILLAIAVATPLLYPSSVPDFGRRIFVPLTNPTPDIAPVEHVPPGGHAGVSLRPHMILVTQDPTFHFPGPQVETGTDGPPDVSLVSGSHSGPPDSGPNVGEQMLPARPPIPVPSVRVSRSMQGYLLHRVEPSYPAIARIAGVQGAVVIKALISREGTIEHLQVINGSPLLSKTAIEAIAQWRYRPYFLNDQPVEVETEITVNFYLNR